MASLAPPVQFIASTATLGAFSTTTLAITATAYRSFNTPAISVPFPTGYGTRQVQLAYSWTATPTGRATTTIGGRAATSGVASVMAEPTRAMAGGSYGQGSSGDSSGGGGGFQWPTWATGVAAGCGGLALIILLLALICWRRRSNRKRAARARAQAMRRSSRKNGIPMSERNAHDRHRLSKVPYAKSRAGPAFAPLPHEHGYDEASFDARSPHRPTPLPAAAGSPYRSGSPYRPMSASSAHLDGHQPYADPRYAPLAPGYHQPAPYPIDPYGNPIMPPSGHRRMDSGASIDSGYETPHRTADMSSASINGSPARLLPNAAPMPVRPPPSQWNVEPEPDFGASIGNAMLSDDEDDMQGSVPLAAVGQARGGTPGEDDVRHGNSAGRQEIEAPLAYPNLPRDDVRNRRSVVASHYQDSPAHSPSRGEQDSRQQLRTDSRHSQYHEARSGSALSHNSDSGRSAEIRRSGERPRSRREPLGPAYDSAHGVPDSPTMDQFPREGR